MRKTSVQNYAYYSIVKIALMILSTVGIIVTIGDIWILTIFQSSLSEAALGRLVFGLSLTEIERLLPFLWLTLGLAPALTLIAWAVALALRRPKQELDEEVMLVNIVRMAESTTRSLVAGVYDDIADMMRIVRIIDQTKQDWPKLKRQIVECSALLAVSSAQELGPLKRQLDELSTLCHGVAATEQDFQATLSGIAIDVETTSTDVARVLALRNHNNDTKDSLLQRLDVLKARLDLIPPNPDLTTNVVPMVQPAE